MDLQVEQEHLKYTEHLDRGVLIIRPISIFAVIKVAYNIFNICVTSDLERKFINVHNQGQTLIGIIEQYITSNDEFIGIYYTRQDCETTYLTRLLRALYE